MLGQGDNAAVVKLTEDKEAFARLEANVDARLAKKEE
jgi:hypothetical protein